MRALIAVAYMRGSSYVGKSAFYTNFSTTAPDFLTDL